MRAHHTTAINKNFFYLFAMSTADTHSYDLNYHAAITSLAVFQLTNGRFVIIKLFESIFQVLVF